MARPTTLTTLTTAPGLFEFERKSSGLPISPIGTYPESQGAESQVDYAAGSGAVSPCYDNSHYQDKADVIPENPFDSESSRVLFDAIDKLQSCGVSQELAIPQLVIVGGQSTGKSSLLQSLTDIPFPVGSGCCTRFATRIVSRRTAPGSRTSVKVTIVEPDVTDKFGYPPDDTYKEFPPYVTDHLGAEEFTQLVETITTKYMGIKRGKGHATKNFASQVLRIELSGPSRSHFSILDVPGIFSYAHDVNEDEEHGVRQMVEEYMRQTANIVICVAAATADLSTQEIFKMAANFVDKSRLVGVFTKCDRLENPNEVIDIASGYGKDSSRSMKDGWFVVRNRSDADDEELDFKEAERKLFSRSPWDRIPETRRGSVQLQKYLGNLLCAQIRGNFPAIQESVRKLLSDAKDSRKSLGEPRSSHSLRQQYIRDVVEKYHTVATKTLKSPGSLTEDSLRVRGLVRRANESFTAQMLSRGHTHTFEDHGVDPIAQLSDTITLWSNPQPATVPTPTGHEQVTTPPATPPTKRHAPPSQQPIKTQSVHAASFVDEIRKQLHIWQTTELPGMVNTEVIQILYKAQSEKWQQIAEHHIENIADDVERASNSILEDVCSPNNCSKTLYEELARALTHFQQEAKQKALRELKEHCRREREAHLQTTDARFHERLQALRTVRLLKAIGASFASFEVLDLSSSRTLFHQLHHSIEGNMVNDVHDVVKVYYELSLEAFIRYTTNDIVEDFVSFSKGPLLGLSTDWVFTLTDEEVHRLAREDDETMERRSHYDGVIEKLQTAHEIAEKARIQTRNLGDM
ncbi:vacuolar sorting protein VPS1 [Colletotrichum costaricense]|uniref:Vacuolar sorting protein VPS1 n=1 Tax=Colletotrichum costaricense TaxID=1209916 RepID=A0AAI9YHB8_9PEZI|nr:vacuolar sorting protein VPS1 [Colletotrichum costaricense]KAK1509140.1 vacuolar sorting protein VPS1 [Colletotrichum costaricense]